jgi:hypothetical protein
MEDRMHWRFIVAAAAAALVACGGPFSTSDTGVAADGGTTGTDPQVSVVAPDDHHEFEIENEDDEHHGDDDFDVEVHVEHANLADPGRCSGSGPCGHLVLLIDGLACGNPNTTSSSPKFKGMLGKCVKVSGQHQIVVQLVDDRGNVLASSAPITVNVTFKGHHDDAQTAPAPGGDDQGEHQGGDDQGGDNHGGGGGGGGDDGSGHH